MWRLRLLSLHILFSHRTSEKSVPIKGLGKQMVPLGIQSLDQGLRLLHRTDLLSSERFREMLVYRILRPQISVIKL
jgi:hypothetical protein